MHTGPASQIGPSRRSVAVRAQGPINRPRATPDGLVNNSRDELGSHELLDFAYWLDLPGQLTSQSPACRSPGLYSRVGPVGVGGIRLMPALFHMNS